MPEWFPLFISFVLGVCVGQFLRFERIRRGKRTFLYPRLSWPSLESRWISAVLVALFLASTTQVTWWTFHQRECNTQFLTTTIDLRRIGDEDRELERQDDTLRNQRDDAMTALVSGLINPPPALRPDALGLLNQYYDAARIIDVKRDDLYAKRADLERQRQAHKLPAQRC